MDLARLNRVRGEKVTHNVVLNSYVWCVFHSFDVLETSCLYKVEVLFGILGCKPFVRREMEQVFRSIILIVIIDWQVVVEM